MSAPILENLSATDGAIKVKEEGAEEPETSKTAAEVLGSEKEQEAKEEKE